MLSACSSFSPDGGMSTVSSLTRERIGHAIPHPASEAAAGAAQTVDALLSRPLTADAAVQVALLNNAGFKADLQAMGIAEADLVQAGRLRNPGFSFARMRRDDEIEIDRSIMFDLVGLLTMPLRIGIEQQRFEQAKMQAAAQAVQLAHATRRAWFRAVAAAQTAQYMEQVRDAAQASAELASRMAAVGNLPQLDRLREQAFQSDALAQLARSRHAAIAAREELARLMGVWGAQAGFSLPDRLPALPASPRAAGQLEADAMRQRLDLQMATRNAQATASMLGLTRKTGVINAVELGYQNKTDTGRNRSDGYEISLELPLFDWGGARVARAQAIYMQSVQRTADLAVRARSEVRQSWSAYRTSYDLARHYQQDLVPLRKRISEEVLLRYNGMLTGVFELLADAREQINTVNGAIDAQRDFWLAETDLESAVNGSGSGGTGGGVLSRSAAPAAASRAAH
ncbi:TolC family protein [Herminiimonas sp.]|uniref:TolC family protein n=1 Tax=Herminiimonas sp. TaxID=1926289 RepID=UPI00271CCDE2|nr:TolC family protein [Herminiimonas sp.]MDO8304835.1 TolC family protein [Herminiimonas sp.]